MSFVKKVFFSTNGATYSYTKLFCCLKHFFIEIDKKNCHLGQKHVFLTKLSHIPLNLAFLLFCSIFTEIDQKIVIYVKKVFSQQIDPHYEQNKAKRCLFVVLKHFYRNWQNTCHFGQNSIFSTN